MKSHQGIENHRGLVIGKPKGLKATKGIESPRARKPQNSLKATKGFERNKNNSKATNGLDHCESQRGLENSFPRKAAKAANTPFSLPRLFKVACASYNLFSLCSGNGQHLLQVW